MKRIYFFLVLIVCLVAFGNCNKKPSKGYKFNTPVGYKEVDTNTDGKIDTKGYFMDDEGNYRLFYNELNRNLDGFTDMMLWIDSSNAPKKEAIVKDVVKVHEEEDGRLDGWINIRH